MTKLDTLGQDPLQSVKLQEALESRYLAYALSTITNRA